MAFMDEGRIVAEGAVDELIAEVAPLREVRVTLAAVTAIPAPQLAGLRSFEQKGEELVALLERDAVHVAGLIEYVASQGGEVRSVEVLGSTLRDAFLAKTGRTVSE